MQQNNQVKVAKSYETPLTKNLQVAITATGSIEVNKVDKVGINIELRKFKNPNNSVNFPALFDIPVDNRITAMAKNNLGETIKLLSVALTLSFETMNLARPMQAFQILDLAEMIVDEAESDRLSIEDILIFCQKLSRGEYNNFYEGMDIPKFMSFFNQYRDERWQAGIDLRDARVQEHKRLGDDNFYERSHSQDGSTLAMQIEHFKNKIQIRKDEIKELKRSKK